jgi:hypothetical protein
MFFAKAEVSSALVDSPQLIFSPFTFAPATTFAESCSIEGVGGRLVTKMALKDVPELHLLESIAQDIHESAVRRIAFQQGASYFDTKVLVTNRYELTESGQVIGCTVGTASCSGGKVVVTQTIEDIVPLRSLLEAPRTSKDRWTEILHHMGVGGDPVVYFIGCYLILAAHHEDDQDRIDEFIKAHEPGVLMETRHRPRRNKPGQTCPVTETIYRRLRNELMHVLDFDAPRDPRELHAAVKKHSSGMARLTRIKISQLD